MTKKQAFVGFSTPLGYDYRIHTAWDKGNPILEAPTGLLILYDDIWFAHEDVCPLNLRDKEFVHFLQDKDTIPDLSDFDIEADGRHELNYSGWDDEYYLWALKNNVVRLEGVDNHHRRIQYAGITATPDPRRPSNLLIDQYLSSLCGLDFIANTATSRVLHNPTAGSNDILKSDNLKLQVTSDLIPCYLSESGPYIEYIDDLRASPYIKDFRRKMNQVVIERPNEPSRTLSADIRHEFEEFRNNCLKARIDTKRIFASCVVDIAFVFLETIPYATLSKSIYDSISNLRRFRISKKYRWTGFLADAEDSSKYYS